MPMVGPGFNRPDPVRAVHRASDRRVVTTNSSIRCQHCQDPIDPRRAALGYDYCTKPECQRRHLKPLELVRITVNKASDQYIGPEELPPRPSAVPWSIDDGGEDVSIRPAERRRRPPRPSTTARLRAAAHALDAQLDERYDEFVRGEITADEMKARQNAAIDAFNAWVRALDIRYRSFVRAHV
jgi:hypothetical protein